MTDTQAPDVVVTEALPEVWRKMSDRANKETDDESDDAHAIGFRDGFENAVQMIDTMTGGDGEYRFSQIPERHCPTPVEMIDNIVHRLSTQSAMQARIEELEAALRDANESVIAFGGPWAVSYAQDFGLPDDHLHPTHYDILAKAGARMDDFTRSNIGGSNDG